MDTALGAAQPAFNGAMTFQPWIRVARMDTSLLIIAFNGAMTFQPWIRGTSCVYGL